MSIILNPSLCAQSFRQRALSSGVMIRPPIRFLAGAKMAVAEDD
jgi:hypothetical protein